MRKTTLFFETEDDFLNFEGSVNWPDTSRIMINDISIRGFGAWRHFPANIIACSRRMIEELKLEEKASKLSKVGINYVGIDTKSDLMIPKCIRTGKKGHEKVKNLLTKFFKALGASSVSLKVIETNA